MTCIKIIEIHGGTSGTEYMYVLKGKKLYHISQLPGAKVINKEELRGGRKRVEWCISSDVLAGSEGIWVSFSKMGRYLFDYYFRLPNNFVGIWELSLREMLRRGFIDRNFKEPLKTLSNRGITFELFGPESSQLEIYDNEVPKLVYEFWRELRSIGINSVYASGHAERSIEMLYDPIYAKFVSMVLPTPQGRIRSLYEKHIRAVELYTLSKIIRALYELGFTPASNELKIEFTTNTPSLVMKSSGGVSIDVLYQPTIVPHVISGFMNNIQKPFHTTPDIALVISSGNIIGWGELANMANKVILIAEIKYELGYQTVYENPNVAIKQIMTYKALLGGIPAIVVIHKSNPAAVRKLKAKGIECIDEVNPNNDKRVRQFMDLVKNIVNKRIQKP